VSTIPHYALTQARRNWRVLTFISLAALIVIVAVIDINYRADAAPVSLTPGKVTGLQKTGFSAGGTLLSSNGGQNDGNWVIDRVIRPAGRGGSTCQKAQIIGGGVRDIPATSVSPAIPAVTIMERNGTAGAYRTPSGRVADGSIAYLGNSTTIVDSTDYIPPWYIVDANARWIGQNQFGQAYSDSSCKDPTDGTPSDYANGNIVVFKLKNGFVIDPSVDLASIQFRLNAIVDNSLMVRVNGRLVQSRLLGNSNPGCNNQTTTYANSQTPGFNACARTIQTEETSGVFRSDQPNTLELHVQSTYSHTGLLIRDIDITGDILPAWSITPTSTVTDITNTTSTTTAKPGDIITWKHEVKNNGPDATERAVTYRRENGSGFPAGSGGTQALPANTRNNGTGSQTSTYRVLQSDVGSTLCRATSAIPQAWNDATRITSAQDCVTIPRSYTLTPTITLDRSGIIETPNSVIATPRVTNSGPTNSSSTQWQLTRIDITPGNGIPNPSGGPSASGRPPCSFFSGGGVACRVIQNGTSVFNANGSVTGNPLNAAAEQIADLPVGTKICFALSVQPRSSASDDWIHSAPICLTVAKKPKVQVLGSDLIVGRGSTYNVAKVSQVVTSTSFSGATSSYYGSWSEYAIIPSGTVKGMASGAMYVDGVGSTNLCNLSALTISNNNGSGCQASSMGRYAFGSLAPNVAGRFPVTNTISGGSVNLRDLTSARTYSVGGSTLNISSSQPIGSAGGRGKWIVINDRDATVRITSNINYTTPTQVLGIPADIPQVVIIARNIIIDESVTNVDAWLIAAGSGNDGYINTCGFIPAGSPNSVNSGNCNQQLTVNGPVMANKLYMYRTAGAGVGAAAGNPAEIFNLRADAYLWASSYSASNGRLPTASTKELPPRF